MFDVFLLFIVLTSCYLFYLFIMVFLRFPTAKCQYLSELQVAIRGDAFPTQVCLVYYFPAKVGSCYNMVIRVVPF